MKGVVDMREELIATLEWDDVIIKLNFWESRKEDLLRELNELALRAKEAIEQVEIGNMDEARQFMYDGGLF